jgi:CheY-like chemotaxis protein
MVTDRDTLTVLVVEDEALIRMGIVDALEAAGVTVIEASNADEAIQALETRKDIELVFTDIDMPGSMDGLRLAACIRDRWPPVRLIVTSGHVAVKDEDLPSGGRFFRKPYSAPDVVRAVAEMTRGGT